MKISRFFLYGTLIVMLLAQNGWWATAQSGDQIIDAPIFDEPSNLNPFTQDTIIAATITHNIFEGMIGFDQANGVIEPALAERWEMTQRDDGRNVYTFYLRQGVLFHQIDGINYADGEREITADIIAWNYLFTLNDEDDDTTIANILGAEAYANGETEGVEGLIVIDQYTLQLIPEIPDRDFLLNTGAIAITSPAAYEQLGENFDRNPVGTGAFQFDSWVDGEQIILAANSDYWGANQPQTDGIRFTIFADADSALEAYQNNELDFMFDIPGNQRETVLTAFAPDLNELPSLHIRYFGFNLESGFLAENPAVRQAMNYALDRQTAWNDLENGARFPATLGMLPPAMLAAEPTTVYTYDLDTAAALLAEAGFPNGEGIPVITINILESIATEAHIELWQTSLAELGIQTELKIEDSTTYWDTIEEDDMMVFISGWAAGRPDPADIFNFLILDGNGAMRYDNPVVNDLLEAAQAETDLDAQIALYQQAHNIIMEDSVVVVSAYGKITWLQKAWVNGFVPGASGTFNADMASVMLNQ